MSLLPVLILGDSRLRQVAAPVGGISDTIRTLAADMCETMYAAPGRGLAAPQVGQLLRMFVMDCHWKDGIARAPVAIINPEIVGQRGPEKLYDEGCLSIPGVTVSVLRPAEVCLRWIDLDGAAQERWFDGFEAVCVQHENDHLDGILTLDRASPEVRESVEAALLALAT